MDLNRVAEVLSGEPDPNLIDITPDQYIETHDESILGIEDRLQRMKRMTEEGRISPRIRQLVGRLVRDCPERDQECELRAIHDYIAAQTRFLDDIRDLELFQQPEITLEFGAGDCDDLSILAASMLESAGFKTQLVAVGHEDYEHVFVRTQSPKPPAKPEQTVAFDLSLPDKEFGFDPATVETFEKVKIVDIG